MVIRKWTPRHLNPSTPQFYAREYLWSVPMTRSGQYKLYVTPQRFRYEFNKRRLCGARWSYLAVKTPIRPLLFKIPSNVRVSVAALKATLYLMCIKKRYRNSVHSLSDLIRATVGGGLHAFRVIMEVRGLGYKVFVTQRDRIDFRLGFSHMVYFRLRNRMYAKALGIKSRVFAVFGYDLIQVTAVAAHIRTMRRINVYKGKGIFKKYFKYKVKEGKRKKN